MCVIWDYYVDLYVLISLCSNYNVILQKLSGRNVCVEGHTTKVIKVSL